MQRDAKAAPQDASSFRPPDNSPSRQHFTRGFLLCLYAYSTRFSRQCQCAYCTNTHIAAACVYKKADRTSYVCLSCRFTASEAADGLCSIIFCAGETAVRVCRPGSEPVVCLFPQALHTADADDLKSTARQVFLRHGAFSPGQTSFAFFPNKIGRAHV